MLKRRFLRGKFASAAHSITRVDISYPYGRVHLGGAGGGVLAAGGAYLFKVGSCHVCLSLVGGIWKGGVTGEERGLGGLKEDGGWGGGGS